jgi:excisionase family DNA binding protein
MKAVLSSSIVSLVMLPERLLRKTAVLERLSVSRPTLDRLIATGQLEVVRVSTRAIRISEGAVREFIERQTERRSAGGSTTSAIADRLARSRRR